MQTQTGTVINLSDVKAGMVTEKITTDEYFGGCPHCGQTDGYVNVQGAHFFICKTHQVYWWIGTNLFSSWKEEDQEIWDKNKQMLEQFTEVEPIHPEPENPVLAIAAEPVPFAAAQSVLYLSLVRLIHSMSRPDDALAAMLKNQAAALRQNLDVWERTGYIPGQAATSNRVADDPDWRIPF